MQRSPLLLRMTSWAIVAVLVAAVVEGAVRLLGIAPPLPTRLVQYATGPYLVWGPVPYSQYTGFAPGGEYSHDLRHNSLGLRDVEHTFGKAAGTLRIVGLGDSFTYGSGAEFHETYLYRTEQALGAGGRRVEIIKAGVSRYFPEPERILLERLGVKYEPDLVIVGFTGNDVVDTCLGLDAIAVTADGQLVNSPLAELGATGVALFRHSHAARIVLRAWVSRNFLRQCSFGLSAYQDEGPAEASWREIEQELGRIAQIAAAADARLLIINIPDPPPWGEAHRYPGARLGAWAQSHGVGFLDLLPALQAALASGGPALYWRTDPHCTPAGYGVIAEALSRHLVTSGLVP